MLGCNAVCERSASNEIGTMIDSVLQVPLLAMIIDKQGSALSIRQAYILVATLLGPVPEPCRHDVVCVSRGATMQLFHPVADGTRMRARRYRLFTDCECRFPQEMLRVRHAIGSLSRSCRNLR